MFSRIAIINRGEAAMRLIHAVQELNAEHPDRFRTIALHTEAERQAMFVREADEAVCLEEPDGAGPGDAPASPYLDHNGLERAMRRAEADAAWVGWGYVAEDPGFAELCARIGVRFIGPHAEVMRRLGDKADVGLLAHEADVPVAPWSAAPLTYVRHLEVQIMGDDHGAVWAIGVHDCSVQRANRKVIEESASSALSPEQEVRLKEASVALAAQAGYRSAGTVDFGYQPSTGAFAFVGVHTCLQSAHTVTEATTGLDMVKLQLHVAGGGRLGGAPPAPRGHAIQARLNAEDPDRAFAPSPGLVEVLAFACGPGIRVDTGVAEGDVIPHEYPMVAKVIASGRDRDEALARLRRALAQTRVVIAGGTTNKASLVDLLDRPEMRTGVVDTRWLDRRGATGRQGGRDVAGIALLAAAIEASDRASAIRRRGFYASAARGRPEMRSDTGEVIELRHGGRAYRLAVRRVGPARYRIVVDGRPLTASIEKLPRFERRLTVAGRRHRVIVLDQAMNYLVEVDGVSYRLAVDDGGVIRAPAPGVVVVVPVHLGDVVAAGDTVAVVESMKIEVAVPAPTSGRVREVCTARNVQVDGGAPLIRLEPVDDATATSPAERITFRDLAADVRPDGDDLDRARAYLDVLRCSILGFELDPREVWRAVDEYRRIRPSVEGDDGGLLRTELHLLTVFADLALLWRNRRGGEDTEEEESHSPIEYLSIYLRSLDTEREGLPAIFRERLQTALSHYGVGDLARTPELEESLYLIFQAQDRAPAQVGAVLALLDQRLKDEGVGSDAFEDELLDTLDRLIVATQLRYPVIGELARSIRYRWFDEPVIRRSSAETLAAMRSHLSYLDANPGADDYEAQLDLLVSSPRPMIGLLAERDPGARGSREPMLEVVTRRYYKIRELGPVRSFLLDDRWFVTGSYLKDGRTFNVIACHVGVAGFAAAAGAAARLAENVPAGDAAVIDLYVRWQGALPDVESLSSEVEQVLSRLDAPPSITRFAVVAIGDSRPEAAQDDFAASYLTFRLRDGRVVEDKVVRGLHPMIANRLQLWRLANFDIEALPTTGDHYLFHCLAKDNPEEERLIAVAEVRDLTPVRDHSGGVAALPELEHTLGACFDALRRAQADRPPEKRLRWNRVLLHVWAPIEVPLDELLPVAGRLAPLTAGLGLEVVLVQGRYRASAGAPLTEKVMRLAYQPGAGLSIRITDPPTQPMRPLDSYTQKVIQARRRGAVYPYELIPSLIGVSEVRAPDQAPGTFTEYDLDSRGRLVAVDRPPGGNESGLVIGVVSLPTARYPEGMVRVVLMGDPTKSLGTIAVPECLRVVAALDLASELKAPVEWFALSSGAKIAMDSGTENMDAVARVLRRLIEFTQAGGEINVVVAGINVGAQPYWNSEATMLLHTRGILVMTPDSAMVLTGKQALDYSGGVSAEDNAGIGGYERIMGPNGQAQYWAPDLAGACDILLAHYEHSYVAPGERFPRRAKTTDPVNRDVTGEPHVVEGIDFRTIGDIFSERTNPGKKKPFDIRTLMRATLDLDHPPLERWAGMRDADTVVVWDGHLGGYPVAMVAVESRPLPRFGPVPADGPFQWSAGTLFPLSSKKMARAINAASGSRPLVILANLSGFDGSPESLRRLQLEYGAEIGRAVVNFDGPIVFCVVSRFHGGAFVVFSSALHDHLEVAAVEGSRASVIGGAPAAAVVFVGMVNARTRKDARVLDLEARIAEAAEGQQAQLRNQLVELRESVRLEHLGEVAAEFDAIHTVERAKRVGSVHRIIPAAELRPYLVDAVERGMRGFLKD